MFPTDDPPKAEILYDNGKTLMARGPLELHEHVAVKVEKALGKNLPQLEVRFKNGSISEDVVVKNDTEIKTELPTLLNVMKSGLRGLRSNNRVVKKEILKNVNGVFKRGTITLVLGQYGSGKSSLLKLRSDRFPKAKNVTIEGDLRTTGPRLPSCHDKHYPALTVKDTLEFTNDCSGGALSERDAKHFSGGFAKENKTALDAARALFKHYPDVIIQQLGLENCQDTVVGDAMLREISGCGRKRVTTGEMEFCNKFVMLMDEISTGLDSASTFDIVSSHRSMAKKFRKTVVISLLQPSPEVFALFDDVMILNEGRVMYHGPRADALGKSGLQVSSTS